MSQQSFEREVARELQQNECCDVKETTEEISRLARRHLLGQGAGFDWEPHIDPDAREPQGHI